MTDKEFCKLDTEFYGEVVDNIKQIKLRSFDGEELKEYVEHCINQNKIKTTTMKWIYLLSSIINYSIFCYDVEYHRDAMTWVWLGSAIAFHYAYHINQNKEDE